MEGEVYVEKIRKIKNELSRRNEDIKKLREQKKIYEGQLYNFMQKKGVEKVGDITKKSITPKEKNAVTKKKKTEQKADAIKYFREQGVPDPRGFWEQLERLKKK